MKRMLVLAVLGLSGCVSITESKFTFIKVPPPVGVRFFVSSVELSEAVRTLPFGDKSASAVLSGRLRECLVNYRNDLFSAASDGAIPIKVNINVTPFLASLKGNRFYVYPRKFFIVYDYVCGIYSN